MSYTYDLIGKLSVSPPLSADQVAYIQEFSHSYRHKFAPKWQSWPNPLREAVGLPVGIEGEYISSAMGTGVDFIENCMEVDTNTPNNQPSFQCCWTTTAKGNVVKWNKLGRTFAPVQWLEYMMEHFFKPWGVTLNGKVECHGEAKEDRTLIVVTNNTVRHAPKKEWEEYKTEKELEQQAKKQAQRIESAVASSNLSRKRKV